MNKIIKNKFSFRYSLKERTNLFLKPNTILKKQNRDIYETNTNEKLKHDVKIYLKQNIIQEKNFIDKILYQHQQKERSKIFIELIFLALAYDRSRFLEAQAIKKIISQLIKKSMATKNDDILTIVELGTKKLELIFSIRIIADPNWPKLVADFENIEKKFSYKILYPTNKLKNKTKLEIVLDKQKTYIFSFDNKQISLNNFKGKLTMLDSDVPN